MNDVPCTRSDQEALVAYLYDEAGPADRRQVETHLAGCPRCADEARSFRAVRESLEAWTVPDSQLGLRIVSEREVTSSGRW